MPSDFLKTAETVGKEGAFTDAPRPSRTDLTSTGAACGVSGASAWGTSGEAVGGAAWARPRVFPTPYCCIRHKILGWATASWHWKFQWSRSRIHCPPSGDMSRELPEPRVEVEGPEVWPRGSPFGTDSSEAG